VHEQAVHAPPSERLLSPGDLVSIDVGVELEGWFGDFAESVLVPGPPDAAHVLRAAQRAVAVAVRASRPGVWWSAVARAVRAALASEGLMALAGYAGHGIGRALHEQPRAAYDARPGVPGDFLLLPGMVFTIEPVVVSPPGLVKVEEDGWTVSTSDGSPACHLERTIAVTRRSARILGLRGTCHSGAPGL
jgi:methionyl aminopeptidase